jgi:UbiA prenyltransferase family protein
MRHFVAGALQFGVSATILRTGKIGMFNLLSRRVLGVLQLTRVGLVFTAVADSFCTLLLNGTGSGAAAMPKYISIAIMSSGLYGFGMSLNDIIDRRRDRQIATHRPLPSGRIGVITAHVACGICLLMALGGCTYYWSIVRDWRCLLFILVAHALIWFYDVAGKYLVPLGILTLGLIRFFHCLVPAPTIPVLWHPLLLFNHVAILSAVAYSWEQKRPPLGKMHVVIIALGIMLIDAIAITAVGTYRGHGDPIEALKFDPSMRWNNWLLLPIAAVFVYIAVGAFIRWRTPGLRDAGQKLVLYGLLWLIIYDGCFVFAYVGWWEGLLMLLFFPASWLMVQLLRWWSKVVSISQRPAFKRVRA